MNISRKLFIGGLIVVAVFAFGFGLAFVGETQAGPSPCCVIPATIHCSEGMGTVFTIKIGDIEEDLCIYYLVPGNPDICQTQLAPQCD